MDIAAFALYQDLKLAYLLVCIHHTLYEGEVARTNCMAFFNSMMAGFGVAAGVVTVLAVSNGLSTYIFNGETLESKVNARIGGGSA